MYKGHFKLSRDPFSLTPDPAFLFLSPDHAEALAGLKLGLKERRGLIVMTGEVGTGKTTLLYSLLSQLEPEIRTAYVSNTRLPFEDILRYALKDLGVTCEDRRTSDMLDALNDFLLRQAEAGATAALVIDEAQNLGEETFEDLRLLSNFETYKSKLLQIVLVGQPELDAKLRTPELRQVAERIAVQVHLGKLSTIQARLYIRHRLEAAGGSSAIFTRPALRLAAKSSRGIPRRMNIACHNALLFAYGRNLARVNRAAMSSALRATAGAGDQNRRRDRPVAKGRGVRTAWAAGGLVAGAAGAIILFAKPGGLQLWARPPLTQHSPQSMYRTTSNGRRESNSSTASRQQSKPARSVARTKPSNLTEDSLTRSPSKKATTISLQPTSYQEDEDNTRMVRVEPGKTLYSITRAIYGRYDPELLRLVQSANPQITNPDHILAGDRLRFPATGGRGSLAPGGTDE